MELIEARNIEFDTLNLLFNFVNRVFFYFQARTKAMEIKKARNMNGNNSSIPQFPSYLPPHSYYLISFIGLRYLSIPPYFMLPFIQSQLSNISGFLKIHQLNFIEAAIRESSPMISDPDQEIFLLKRYCIWLGEQYSRQKNNLKELAKVLMDWAYILEILRKKKDTFLKKIIGKKRLIILL